MHQAGWPPFRTLTPPKLAREWNNRDSHSLLMGRKMEQPLGKGI
jgi:hypothetical protein